MCSNNYKKEIKIIPCHHYCKSSSTIYVLIYVSNHVFIYFSVTSAKHLINHKRYSHNLLFHLCSQTFLHKFYVFLRIRSICKPQYSFVKIVSKLQIIASRHKNLIPFLFVFCERRSAMFGNYM